MYVCRTFEMEWGENHFIPNFLALTKIISKDHFSFQARGGIGVGFQEYFKRNFWHH